MSGYRPAEAFRFSSESRRLPARGASISKGAIALTRMRKARSAARDRVSSPYCPLGTDDGGMKRYAGMHGNRAEKDDGRIGR